MPIVKNQSNLITTFYEESRQVSYKKICFKLSVNTLVHIHIVTIYI